MSNETFRTLDSMEEIARHLGDKRERLLRTFIDYDDNQIDTSTLRVEAGVATGSIHHHLETLVEWGFVREHNTRRYTPGGGSDARQWSLTDRGHEFYADVVDNDDDARSAASPEPLGERVAALEQDMALVKGIVMRIGVDQGTITKAQAKDVLSEERFQELFEE